MSACHSLNFATILSSFLYTSCICIYTDWGSTIYDYYNNWKYISIFTINNNEISKKITEKGRREKRKLV